MDPLLLIYNAAFVDSIQKFFANRSSSQAMQGLADTVQEKVTEIKERTFAELALKPAVTANIHIDAPWILVPRDVTDPCSEMLGIHLGDLSVETAPSASNVEWIGVTLKSVEVFLALNGKTWRQEYNLSLTTGSTTIERSCSIHSM